MKVLKRQFFPASETLTVEWEDFREKLIAIAAPIVGSVFGVPIDYLQNFARGSQELAAAMTAAHPMSVTETGRQVNGYVGHDKDRLGFWVEVRG